MVLHDFSLWAFVQAPMAEGIVEISPMRRVALDAQTRVLLRVFHTSTLTPHNLQLQRDNLLPPCKTSKIRKLVPAFW